MKLRTIPLIFFFVSVLFMLGNYLYNQLEMLIMWGVLSIGYISWFSWCVLRGEEDGK